MGVPPLQLQPITPVKPQPLPYAEPPAQLNLNPPRGQLNLQPAPKPTLNLQPAPKTPLNLGPAPLAAPAGSAGVAFKSAPLAITALLAGGFVLGTQIGNEIYSAFNPDDPNFNDYLRDFLQDVGLSGSQNHKYGSAQEHEQQKYEVLASGGQDPGVLYRVTGSAQTILNGNSTGVYNFDFTGPGPVSSFIRDLSSESVAGYEIVLTFGNGREEVLRGGTYDPSSDTTMEHELISVDITRADGQPDNSGQSGSSSTVTSSGKYEDPQPIKVNPQQSTPAVPLVPQLLQAPKTEPSNLPFAEPPPAIKPELQLKNDPSRLQLNERPKLALNPGTQQQSQKDKTPPPTKVITSCNPCNSGVANNVRDQLDNLKDQLGNVTASLPNNLAELLGLGAITATLATIIEKLTGVASAVGVDAFPISAPTTINQCDTRPPRQINNLAEGQLWQTDQLDSVMGQWCNTMEVDTPNGKKELKMDTMADATQEMMGLLISMAIGQGLNQQGIMKGLAEMTQIKQQSFLSTQFSRANAEYLGYTANQTKVNMPSSVTPGANSLLDFLNPSQLSTLGYRNQDTTDLQTCLRELCHAAAIIRAVFQRNVNPDNIENDLKGQFDRARGVAAGRDDSDFDDFIRDVELGFDIPNAYGRIFNNRPQVHKKDG